MLSVNATDLLKNLTSAPALSRRVRIKNDPRVVGEVIDVADDGWLMWVSEDGACHFSKPDYVEAAS